MASTSRRKKTAKKKVVPIRAEIKKEKTSIEDKLSSHDLRTIENYSKDVQIAKVTMNLQEQFLRNLVLEHQLMQINIAKQKERVADLADKFEQRKERFTEFKKTIGPKYGLKENEGLGYNPETGEIVR